MNDTAIKRLVESELEWAPGIDAADIGVTVDAGIVTLSGHLPSFAQKITAEHTVKRLRSVRGFVDKLEVRFAAHPGDDEDIAKRAANILDWDVTVPKGAVKVSVAGGYVTLTGEAPWQYQKVAAGEALHRLAGVRGVSNEITVKPTVKAEDIKHRIEAALDRQADIEAAKVKVTVDGDRVRLDGKVRAWFEREAAEEAAWAAPGVRFVDDRVMIGS
jgi:osmotically-inducible protein OsmY